MGRRKRAYDQTITPHPFLDDVYCVPMMNGGHALIEGDDVCRVDEYRWYKEQENDTWYACSRVGPVNKKYTKLRMSRLLFGLTREDRIEVDHENHDGLDNRRKANLRLATREQNIVNRRKHRNTLNPYKGVAFRKEEGTWVASIGATVLGRKFRINLGTYKTSEEAAFAYGVAAPLLQDADFLCLEAAHSGMTLAPERKAEIKGLVLVKVKAILRGEKGVGGSKSIYFGVSYAPSGTCWVPHIVVGNAKHRLGRYLNELEAAFAYNCGLTVLGLNRRRVNDVSADMLRSSSRAAEIEAEVRSRIELPRCKVRRGCASRYNGVSWEKKAMIWCSEVTNNGKRLRLGRFSKEEEAAVAYNIAASILGKRDTLLNSVPSDVMPPKTRLDAIRSRVEMRVAVCFA